MNDHSRGDAKQLPRRTGALGFILVDSVSASVINSLDQNPQAKLKIMSKTLPFLLIAFWFAGPLESASQTDPCAELQSRYDSLQSTEDDEAALNAVLELSDCLLQAESDSSLRYAVSLRWVGNRFIDLAHVEEASDFYQQSLDVLSSQGRTSHPDFAHGLNNLARNYHYQGDYARAEEYYLRTLEIRRSVLGESHPDFASSLENLSVIYSAEGDYTKAEGYFLRALEIKKSVLGESHPDVAWTLENLANNYYDQGNYAKAEDHFLQSLEIRRTVLGESHPDFAWSLENLAVIYSTQGDYGKAEEYFLLALEIKRSVLGESHPDFTWSLENLAALYNTQGDYAKAEENFLRALEIKRSVLGESHPEFARSLENLAALYNTQGDYAKAEKYYLRALEIWRTVLGESHQDFALSLENLANNYRAQGDYPKAEEYNIQALEIRRSVLGEMHPAFASSLNNLAVNYYDQGDYAKAEAHYMSALEIWRNVLGESHPNFASCLYNLAINYDAQSDYARAEEYYLRALDIRRSVLGELHPDCASSLTGLAVNCTYQGDYTKAKECYLRALEIRRSVYGESHPAVAKSLANLAIYYSEQGDYNKAEEYYFRALEISRSVLGESHPDFAKSLNNSAINYYDQGDYAKAEEYHLRALDIWRSVLGESHPNFASSLNNLANIYFAQSDYARAEEYSLWALEIRRSVLGELHPDFAKSLNNLALIYNNQGNFYVAEEYHLRALEIWRSVLGESHPNFALSLENLAVNCSDQGDYSIAEEYYLRALEIRRSVLGESHPDFAKSLKNLANNYSAQGDYAKAVDYRRRHLALERQLIAESFVGMTAHQRSLFWELKNDAFASVADLAVSAPEEKGVGALAYDGLLFGKGLLLSSSRELDEAVLATGDSVLLVAYEELKASRRMLTKLQSEGDANPALLDFHEARAERNEKLISQDVGAYQAMQERLGMDWKDVRGGLQKGEAAIEFGSYWSDADSTVHYAGFVVTRSTKRPIVVHLFSERDLDLKWAELAAFGPEVLYRQINKDLGRAYAHIWEPLEAHLAGIETVYYSGAGLLNQFPLHALYQEVEGTRQYVLDRFDIRPLSTTRLIAEGLHRRSAPLENDLLALGGLNYDALPKVEALPAAGQDELAFASVSQRLLTDPTLRGGEVEKWGYLEGTRKEVEALQDSLTEAHWDVQTLTWSEGDEGSLKQRLQADPPAVLHLATHGYAFPNPYAETNFDGTEKQRTQYRIGEDPLVRTGLILSGGNHAWMGSDTLTTLTGEDGVLTAAELANMNLLETGLVVMSACETGLGEANGMEGTMGLFRGLKLAGVEEVVQSFWGVPDAETKELMALFYGQLAQSLNPAAAFRSAQEEMRNNYPDEPALWASFSLIR